MFSAPSGVVGAPVGRALVWFAEGMEHFSNTTGTEQTEQIQSQIEDVKGIMVENVGTNRCHTHTRVQLRGFWPCFWQFRHCYVAPSHALSLFASLH